MTKYHHISIVISTMITVTSPVFGATDLQLEVRAFKQEQRMLEEQRLLDKAAALLGSQYSRAQVQEMLYATPITMKIEKRQQAHMLAASATQGTTSENLARKTRAIYIVTIGFKGRDGNIQTISFPQMNTGHIARAVQSPGLSSHTQADIADLFNSANKGSGGHLVKLDIAKSRTARIFVQSIIRTAEIKG